MTAFVFSHSFVADAIVPSLGVTSMELVFFLLHCCLILIPQNVVVGEEVPRVQGVVQEVDAAEVDSNVVEAEEDHQDEVDLEVGRREEAVVEEGAEGLVDFVAVEAVAVAVASEAHSDGTCIALFFCVHLLPESHHNCIGIRSFIKRVSEKMDISVSTKPSYLVHLIYHHHLDANENKTRNQRKTATKRQEHTAGSYGYKFPMQPSPHRSRYPLT